MHHFPVLAWALSVIADRADLSGDEITLLQLIGMNADRDGRYQVSVAELAACAGLSDSGVQGATKRLEMKALIAVHRKRVIWNQNLPNVYHLPCSSPSIELGNHVIDAYALAQRWLSPIVSKHSAHTSICADRTACAALLAIAAHSEASGATSTSNRQLARWMGYSERSLRYGLSALELMGVIYKAPLLNTYGGCAGNAVVILNPSDLATKGDLATDTPPLASQLPPVAISAPPPANPRGDETAPLAGGLANQRLKSPSGKQKANPGSGRKYHFDDPRFPEKLVVLWNNICVPRGCLPMGPLTWPLVNKISQCYEAHKNPPPSFKKVLSNINDWKNLFEWVCTSLLFTGKVEKPYRGSQYAPLSFPQLFDDGFLWTARTGEFHRRYDMSGPATSSAMPTFSEELLRQYSPRRAPGTHYAGASK